MRTTTCEGPVPQSIWTTLHGAPLELKFFLYVLFLLNLQTQRNKQTNKQTKLNSGVSISFLRLAMLTISCRCYIVIDDVSRYAWNRSTLNKSCFP
jgi:hypothetical protein